MAKNKKPADAAKDKAAKQKKIAIGLVVLLAVAMAYAVNTMMGMSGSAGAKPQAADPAATTPSTTPVATPDPTAAAAPSLGGAPVPADPAAAPAADGSTPAGSTALLAVVSPSADPGQLDSFSRFESKDPFAGGAASKPTSGGTGAASGGSSGSSSSSPPALPPAPPNPPSPPPTSAVISVNGLSESVGTSAIFPTSSPNATTNGLFELVSLTATTATVSVVGGSYASGSQTLKLTVNKPVTLVNTADGTRYTLVLYKQGTAAPAAPAGSSSSGASAAPASPATTTSPATGG